MNKESLKMSNFYLVCGISGGGKTVLTHKIVELNPQIDVALDVDEYYAKINGDERIRDNSFTVWHTMYKDIHDYEVDNKNVLLTTNSLTVSQRRQFVEWFPTFKHHMLWVTSPWERCVEGNEKRYRSVPIESLKKQWDTMEFPNANEDGWVTISQITNFWNNKDYIIFNLKGRIEDLLSF